MPCNFHVLQALCFPDLPTDALLPSAFHPPFHLLCTWQPLCFSAAPGFSWDRLVISSSFLTHPFPWLDRSCWGAVWAAAVSIDTSRAGTQQKQLPAHGELQGNKAMPHPTPPQSVSSQGLPHPINHNTLQNLLRSRDGAHQEPSSTVGHLSTDHNPARECPFPAACHCAALSHSSGQHRGHPSAWWGDSSLTPVPGLTWHSS